MYTQGLDQKTGQDTPSTEESVEAAAAFQQHVDAEEKIEYREVAGTAMSEHSELHAVDLIEIEALAGRTLKLIGRRRFVTVAAKTLAFSIPASMVIAIPHDALAVGSGKAGSFTPPGPPTFPRGPG